MASTIYDVHLQTPLNGVITPFVGYWVQLVSNNTGTAYVSTAKTDGTGKATFNPKPPGDTYVVNTSLVSSMGPWSAFGVSNWAVPVVQGENVSVQSVTGQTSSPYLGSALPGGIDTTNSVRIGGPGPWIDPTAPSVKVGSTTYTMGAKYDGITDDAPAHRQAALALAALGGGTVLIPPGTTFWNSYDAVGNMLPLTSGNVHVMGFGWGSIIKQGTQAQVNSAMICMGPANRAQTYLSTAGYNFNPAKPGDATITTTVASDAGNFVVGDVSFLKVVGNGGHGINFLTCVKPRPGV